MSGGHARPSLPEGPYLVGGLGRSGTAAANALAARGFEVIATDSGTPTVEELHEGVEVHTQGSGISLVDRAAVLIKSPGMAQDAPLVAAAREQSVLVMGELELGWRLVPNDFVAVTGTNGKTTTVELIGAIHRSAGVQTAVAGNVGLAVSALEGKLSADAVVVCEASSFQLEDTIEFAPDAAALLNLTADHLDRHGTFADYRAAKLEIFRRQTSADIAVMPYGFDARTEARAVHFGEHGDVTAGDEVVHWRGEALIAVDEIRLRGPHNLLNAMAACAVTLARGIDPEAVCEALRSFAGVEHRLEEIAEVDGVLYVNDSKATNVASALVALRSFARAGVHLIAGGQGKGQDFAQLADAAVARNAAVYTIGEDGPQIAAVVEGAHECGTLEGALQAARAAASPGHVVLLSPACASFDQFRDYEERGERFRELVGQG